MQQRTSDLTAKLSRNEIIRTWGQTSYALLENEIETYFRSSEAWLKKNFNEQPSTERKINKLLSETEKLIFESLKNNGPLIFLPTTPMYKTPGFEPEADQSHIVIGASKHRIMAAAESIIETSKTLKSKLKFVAISKDNQLEKTIQLVNNNLPFLKSRAALSKKFGIPLGLDSTGDTLINEHSLPASYDSIKQLITAANQLLKPEAKSTIALTISRPPGHHAMPQSSSGFCVLNKVAITAAKLCNQGKNVLIVDIDVHNGDGTTECLLESKVFNDKNVRLINTFEQRGFPFTSKNQINELNRSPKIKSLPFASQTKSNNLMQAIATEINNLEKEDFKADIILVSYGLDGHKDDPIGNFNLDDKFYISILKKLSTLGIPIVITLEGGYNLNVIHNIFSKLVTELPNLNNNILSKTPASAGIPNFFKNPNEKKEKNNTKVTHTYNLRSTLSS